MTSRRAKLTDEFVRALAADFEAHGAAALERVRTENPSRYCQLAADLTPKEVQVSVEGNPFSECTSREDLADRLLLGIGANRVSTEMRQRAIEELTRHGKNMRKIAGVIEVLPVIEREALRRINHA